MKTVPVAELRRDISRLLDDAQEERILVSRNGKRSVVLVGVQYYDDKDWRHATSRDSWRKVEAKQNGGKMPPPAKAKKRSGSTGSKALGKKKSAPKARPRTVTKRSAKA